MSETASAAIPCPPEQIWDEIATGLRTGDSAEAFLLHASQCQACADLLRDSIEVFAAGEKPPVMTMPVRPEPPERVPWRWIAAAAAVLLVAAPAVWFALRNPIPSGALAEAYASRRQLELRWPGARHADLRRQLGSSDLPAEFYGAREKILRALEKYPDRPDWIVAHGESLILEGKPDEAIGELKRALDLSANSTRAKLALAAAYFQRAERENRAIDFQAADQRLGEVLQAEPENPVALFNRAIIQGRLENPVEAIALWDRLLNVEKDPRWRVEAENHRNKQEEKIRARQRGRANPSPEVRFENWLAKPAPGEASTAALAADMAREHGDRWLADLERSGGGASLIRRLGSLAARRARIDVRNAPGEMQELLGVAAVAPEPLFVWAAFEYAYWQTHATDQDAPWTEAIERALSAATRRGYRWFAAQLLLERSSRNSALGRHAANIADVDAAVELAESARLGETHLRAQCFVGTRKVRLGDYRAAAEVIVKGLGEYWSAGRDFRRAYHFYFDLMRVAQAMQRPHAAYPPMQAALAVTREAGTDPLIAIAEVRVGEWLAKAGLPLDAAYLERASQTVRNMPEGSLRRTYEMLVDLSRAEAERNAPLLDRHIAWVDSLPEPYMKLRFFRVRADLLLEAGRAREAADQLERALRFAEESARQLAPEERAGWLRELGEAWRSMVAAKLSLGQIEDAFATWQLYLATPGADSARLPERLDLGAVERVRDITSDGATEFVAYFRHDDRIGRWRVARGELRFDWLPARASELSRSARRLAALCADPDSPDQALTEAAAGLRRALLEPGEAVRLLVQPDGDLFRVPWNVLRTRSSERGLVVVVPWLGRGPASNTRLQLRRSRGVLFAATQPAGRWAAQFTPLPQLGDEVRAVSGYFADASVVAGQAATGERLNRDLERADVLHYAGHGYAGADGVRLVLADDLWRPAASRRWDHVRLAVFSACSAARYEETDSAEPVHLAQAFLMGGAGSVVGALWNVDAGRTREWMENFYRSLNAGGDPAAAVQAAGRAVAQSAPHPYWWAAFQLYQVV